MRRDISKKKSFENNVRKFWGGVKCLIPQERASPEIVSEKVVAEALSP
jgi:hypothetical protein